MSNSIFDDISLATFDGLFEKENKPSGLTKDEKKNTMDVEIHRDEIKEYAKNLKTVKSNLKKYIV